MALTPRRPDAGSYLEAALGLRARLAGALRADVPGPCAPADSPAEGSRGRGRTGAVIRPGGGWRRRGGGRAGASKRVSERGQLRP